jgi:hypothetical protein
MFKLNLGSLPEWFSAGSLLLALWIFAQDRRNQARRQVDQVGVWYEILSVTQGAEPTVTVDIVARNASQLPVQVYWVRYQLSGWWKAASPKETAGRPRRIDRWEWPGDIPPGGGEWRKTVQHTFGPGPADKPLSVLCRIAGVWVIDNAGRGWLVTGEGRAKHPLDLVERMRSLWSRTSRHRPES